MIEASHLTNTDEACKTYTRQVPLQSAGVEEHGSEHRSEIYKHVAGLQFSVCDHAVI
jgi:hypothetical protein